MSVNLLNHDAKPIEISDELESFFHVLVYYAVRHLRSNCPHIPSWIDNYFHRYAGPEHMLTCRQKSYAVEVAGTLEIRSPMGPLVFRSPMDGILAPILECLRAHYKVMAHETSKAALPPPRPETLLQPSSCDAMFLIRNYHNADLNPEKAAQWRAQLRARRVKRGPTPEERELAKKVADHKFMLGHLAITLGDPLWRGDDRIPTTQNPEASIRTRPRNVVTGSPASVGFANACSRPHSSSP
ncbi:hypothetical protein DICSQDRAFT_172076 [Dichomitus squalens LYAD-421 SS1]|uniref:Fungal-type protein kinase domain-containing protein n=1 Tax=Dichomitus squalens (strain LYAD-421) TaxID=732165 RepID=R7STT3_DICSQ|nr:uncharacterized protein DICSQDRAFT_172076 [Dichomitus squalens LYAD-421 SS1]EJF59481.1 hypothetical protein DICSQDRAFT_172076 [Dichomitus squalens LYAD-421 SS1]